MEVLDPHQVTDDRLKSTDWTLIGARILEAATLATAIHLDEMGLLSEYQPDGEDVRWDRENSDGNG